MADAQTCEVGAMLKPLETRFWNDAC